MRRRGPEGKGRGGDTKALERRINSINREIENLIKYLPEVNELIETIKNEIESITHPFGKVGPLGEEIKLPDFKIIFLDNLFDQLEKIDSEIQRLLLYLDNLISNLENASGIQGGVQISNLINTLNNLINQLEGIKKNLGSLKSLLNDLSGRRRNAYQDKIKKLDSHINKIGGKINLLMEKLENFQQFRG